MSLQLESISLSYEAQIAKEHRERRVRWASRAVIDPGIDLQRHRRPPAPPVEIIEPSPLPEVPRAVVKINKPNQRDWLWVTRPAERILAFPPDILHTIVMAVCHKFEITLSQIRSDSRTKVLVIPRHIAMVLCNELTLKSLPVICREFNNRDHTCAVNARKRMAERVLVDPWVCQMMAEVRLEMETYLRDWRGIEAVKINAQ